MKYREVVGSRFTISNNEIQQFSTIPELEKENDEYALISEKIKNIVINDSSALTRRHFISIDHKGEGKPSCWLSDRKSVV